MPTHVPQESDPVNREEFESEMLAAFEGVAMPNDVLELNPWQDPSLVRAIADSREEFDDHLQICTLVQQGIRSKPWRQLDASSLPPQLLEVMTPEAVHYYIRVWLLDAIRSAQSRGEKPVFWDTPTFYLSTDVRFGTLWRFLTICTPTQRDILARYLAFACEDATLRQCPVDWQVFASVKIDK